MFKLVHFLFLALAVLSASAVFLPGDIDLSSRELSNAARLARGLPPRSPTFGRFLPGRSSPVLGARVPTTSPVVPVSGNIRVTRADTGDLLGYVSGIVLASTYHAYGVTSDQSSALKVSFNPGSNPLELTETPPTESSHPFLGAVTRLTNDLAAGTTDSLIITDSSHTDAGAPPSPVGNSFDPTELSESTIWNYNSVTHELTATWINTNSAAAPTTLFYFPPTNLLLLVGDPVVFNNRNPGYVVKWTVV